MTTINFTSNLLRHVDVPAAEAKGTTVKEVLEAYFEVNPRVRGYVLDDQGALRKHVAIFLNNELIHDRKQLSDPISGDADIYVAQALSGG